MAEIPERAVVVGDWESGELRLDKTSEGVGYTRNLDVPLLMHVLAMTYAAATEQGAFVIQTMPVEAFEELVRYSDQDIFDAYSVIGLDDLRGQTRTPVD